MTSLGEEFRAAREARRLSVSDVAEHIHIRSVYLQCIEDEDWSAIAAPVYVRGFLRTYARFLGLDPEAAVARYNATVGTAPGYAPAPSPELYIGRRGPSPWLWVSGIVALALVAFVLYDYVQFRASPPPVPVAASSPIAGASPSPAVSAAAVAPGPSAVPSPVASAAPAPLAAVVTKHALALAIDQPTWIRVVVDGAVVEQGTLPAGTRKVYRGKDARVLTGNAGGVALTVDGRELGKMGAPGAVVERTFAL